MTDERKNLQVIHGGGPEKPRLTAAQYQAALTQGAFSGSGMLAKAMEGWEVLFQDADADLADLDSWRATAWTLIRENPAAISGIDRWVTETIGTGLRPQADFNRGYLADLTGLDDQAFDDLEMALEDDFQDWAENKLHSDAYGQHSWYDQQALFMKSKQVAGDGLALLAGVQRRHSPYMLRCQLIDPARLSNENDVADTRRLAGGVQRDGTGYVTRYHIRDGHPDSSKLDARTYRWAKIPAYGAATGRPNVCHFFDAIQPEASRGMPLLKPIVRTVKQMGRFDDATVMAAVVHAFFSVFFEGDPAGGFTYGDGTTSEGTNVNADGTVELREGTGMKLPAGVKANLQSPGQPGPNIDQFQGAMNGKIGMALGIPREVLEMQFRSSYSAARGALNQFWKSVIRARGGMVGGFCKPTWVAFLIERVVAGVYDMPGFMSDPRIRAAWCRSQWLGPSRGMIDKPKEILPELELYNYNAKPLSVISEELNATPFHSTLRRIERDKRMLRAAGLQDAQSAPKLLEALRDQQDLFGTDDPVPTNNPGE